jgi:hypothetical protein
MQTVRNIIADRQYTYGQLEQLINNTLSISQEDIDVTLAKLMRRGKFHKNRFTETSRKLTEYFVNENKKKELTAKEKREAIKIGKRPGVADTKPRRTRTIKKKVPPPPPLPQEIQDELTTEVEWPIPPSEGIVPEAPPYEYGVSSTYYPLPEYIAETEGPDNNYFKQTFDGILKQIDIFQDPVEVKTFLKETRQRRKVLIDIPYESIEEIQITTVCY